MTPHAQLLLAALLVGCGAGGAAQVERVIDGDTLMLRGGERIRLACMDTPERGQPSAAAATRRLQQLTTSGIQVEPLTTDRFGRTVGEVWTTAGVNVGSAWWRRGWRGSTSATEINAAGPDEAPLRGESCAGLNRIATDM
ncbi:hypothetical protein EVJ50_06810 [Synechococcus sp. RSCCF101]|uniref:thermonuclease family protein n=1 Tax=Synechococcus sp. RSCCF101 TaxID=2511069 RepID=UPI001248D87F|nr:thermonuclease family protein [Synechococcus sp. RSCCF101]QEY31991.1 hypothetical protein EVJ50_06810 [Synechococcus sp. RSCCF101]